jgi:hypothetical protein
MAFAFSPNEIAITPDQPTPGHQPKIIERKAEFGSYDVQAIQSDTSSMISNAADNEGCTPAFITEEQQHAGMDIVRTIACRSTSFDLPLPISSS